MNTNRPGFNFLPFNNLPRIPSIGSSMLNQILSPPKPPTQTQQAKSLDSFFSNGDQNPVQLLMSLFASMMFALTSVMMAPQQQDIALNKAPEDGVGAAKDKQIAQAKAAPANTTEAAKAVKPEAPTKAVASNAAGSGNQPGSPAGNLGAKGTSREEILAGKKMTQQLHVSPNGSDNNPGTPDKPLRTIAKAAELAKPGTAVHVAAGEYEGGFTTSKSGTADAPIAFLAEKGVKIKGGNGDTAWASKGANVVIDGFEIDGNNTNWRIGIYTTGSGSIVSNNSVHDIGTSLAVAKKAGSNGGAGILADSYYGGKDLHVLGNKVTRIGPQDGSNAGHFIQGIYHTGSGSIRGNDVSNISSVAIHLWHDAANISIENNRATGSKLGILVGGGDFVHSSAGADNVKVSGNIVTGNEKGISEQGKTGTNNVFSNNQVSGNGKDLELQKGKVIN